jgi:hypothetical protein
VAGPLAAWIVWRATEPSGKAGDRVIEAFRNFEIPEDPDQEGEGYRATKLKPRSRVVALKTVVAAPFDLAVVLDRLGAGAPRSVLELHPKIAYAAFIDANELSLSDRFTVLLRLEEAAPTLSVRPLVATEPSPKDVVVFKKDPEFSARMQVLGADAKAVRTFLSAVVRDAILDSPDVWIEAQGKALAVSAFGPFDLGRCRRVVELADVLFAEYGADGGPSLLEPSGEEVKKKRKKKAAAPAARATEADA